MHGRDFQEERKKIIQCDCKCMKEEHFKSPTVRKNDRLK